jgi:hypothetical protein
MKTPSTFEAEDFDAVLNITGDVLTHTQVDEDAAGNPVYTWEASTEGAKARKEVITESEGRREFVKDKKTVKAEYRLYLKTTVTVTEQDRWSDTDGIHEILYVMPFDEQSDAHHREVWLGITR